jgi:hypothetical protein
VIVGIPVTLNTSLAFQLAASSIVSFWSPGVAAWKSS